MITYTWEFNNFEIYPDTKVVKTIKWNYRGTHEDGRTFMLDGVSELPPPDMELFVPFESITKEWAEETVANNISSRRTISEMQEHINLDISLQVPIVPVVEVAPPF
jgi:hypothetical protein